MLPFTVTDYDFHAPTRLFAMTKPNHTHFHPPAENSRSSDQLSYLSTSPPRFFNFILATAIAALLSTKCRGGASSSDS